MDNLENKDLSKAINLPFDNQKISEKEFIKQRDEIIARIKKIRYEFNMQMYKDFTELYMLYRKFYGKVICRKIAKDMDVTPTTVYRILSFNNASPYVKKLVEDGILTMPRVTRVLYRIHKDRLNEQDAVFKEIVENKITTVEADLAFSNSMIDKKLIAVERNYRNEWNIARDIDLYCNKLIRILLSIKKVPDTKKKEIYKILNNCNKAIAQALKKMK